MLLMRKYISLKDSDAVRIFVLSGIRMLLILPQMYLRNSQCYPNDKINVFDYLRNSLLSCINYY